MYGTKEVAARLGLAQETIKKYIQKKYIKASKVGRDWVVGAAEMKRLEKKYEQK